MPTRIFPFTSAKAYPGFCALLLVIAPVIAHAVAPTIAGPVARLVHPAAARRSASRSIRGRAVDRRSPQRLARRKNGSRLRFADVPRDHWAAAAIQGLLARHILAGQPRDKFGGDRPVTRYEMAVVLYRMVKYMETDTAKKPVILKGVDPVPYTPPGSHPKPAPRNKTSPDTGVREVIPGNLSPVGWLIKNQYLTPDTLLADPPASASVSPALLSDSLAYVVDRILLNRSSPAERERELQKDE